MENFEDASSNNETPSADVFRTKNVGISQGQGLAFLGVFLFTFLVYFRPYEWSASLTWLQGSAFWVAISTFLLFIPTQLSLENRLTAPEREVKLMLLLLIAGALSIPFAEDSSLAWSQFVDFSKVAAIFIVMVNVLRTRQRLKVMLLLLLSVTMVLSVGAAMDYALGNLTLMGMRVEGIIGGLFSNPNDLALQFVIMAPIAIVICLSSQVLLSKVFYFAIATLIVVGVVATFSRGGLVGLVVALSVLIWRLANRNRLALVAILLSCFLLVPALAGYSSRFSTVGDQGSASVRMDNLKRSIYVAVHHPFWGIGMDNFRIYSNNGQVTHNAYTQVFVEMGFAALCFYVALIVSPLKELVKIGHVKVDGKRDSMSFLAVGLEASIWGYLLCSFFASVAYLWYAYYLVAFAISLRRLQSARTTLTPQPTYPWLAEQ